MMIVVFLMRLSLGFLSYFGTSGIHAPDVTFAKADASASIFAEAKTNTLSNTVNPDTFAISCESDDAVFSHGEELKYVAYYKLGFVWFRIGEVTFSVKENNYSYILTAKGFSYPKYSWMFPVDDYYQTILSKKTLKPMSSIRDIHEGGYDLYEHVEYDWGRNRAIVTSGKSKENTSTNVVDIQSCARDLLSLPYYLRVQDYTGLSIGEFIPFHVFLNRKNYKLALRYEVDEVMDFKKSGVFKTHKYTAHTIPGTTFGDDGSVMTAYISADANKVPLYIESDVYVGSVKLILEETSNLKFPFASKLSNE